MRTALLLSFLAFLFFACTQEKPQKPQLNAADFSNLLEEYYQSKYKYYPIGATYDGIEGYNDYLTINITDSFNTAIGERYDFYLNELEKFDDKNLNKSDQISYKMLKWTCSMGKEGLTFETDYTPINQFWSLPNTMGQLASGASAQPFDTEIDYENWLKRVDDFMVWVDTAIINMKDGIKVGDVLPKALTVKVIPQLEVMTNGPIEDHLYYRPVLNFPENFTEEQKSSLTRKYRLMVEEKIIPKFTELTTFFKEVYLPASRETSGLSDIPEGSELYEYLIKVYTTLDISADSIFNLGMSEVNRITSEMEKIKEQVGFEGDIIAFNDYVRNKPELMPFKDPQEVIDNFNAIHERMKPNLTKLFDLVPKTEFEVRRTEAFREKSASAQYNPASLDGSRPGIFYVPIPEVEKYNTFSDEDLFLHEAIPGHHYQLSIQQENDSLPSFRKTAFYSAFSEGWALYCESLGNELGLYEDPYQYYGMLSAEMHRAIRLVVDAGIHAKGWTREQAIEFSLEHEAESESSIISEIERYMAWPGQALSYKMGQLKIRELRTKAENELGDQFDIREFHNKVLENGCIPLTILETQINDWIESKKN